MLVYAVQQCPDLIKSVEVNEGVDNLIIGGANLMWAGERTFLSGNLNF